ncbi:MAG: response regulator, partial [Lysobacter sp.]|nr:response regulator [Lysobacter sp.]
LLHGVGLAVDTAEDGEQAVAMARDNAYDLVLMDVQMPRLDGMAATRAIRTLPGREHLPILAMTANAFAEDRRACEEAGMNDFVPKPVDPEALYAALSHWLAVGAAQGRLTPTALAGPQAAGAADTDALARLAALPGLDLARGLAVVRGNAIRYLELLRRVVDSRAGDVDSLRASLARDEREAARAMAHNLKGVAGTVGAVRLAAHAARLEERLRKGEDPATLPADIAAEFALLADALPPAAPAAPAKSPELPPPDPAALAPLLDEMQTLLAHNDARVISLLQQNEHTLRAALGASQHTLADHVRRFEFEQALGVLRGVRP